MGTKMAIEGKTAPKVQGCTLQEGGSHWPAEAVTLRYSHRFDIHRGAPGRYVVRSPDGQWTLPRSFKASGIKLGPITLWQSEWRALTGILEAAWSVLDVAPCDRAFFGVALVARELPPEVPRSIVINVPIEIVRVASGRFAVHAPGRSPIDMEHLPPGPESTFWIHGINVTRRQWMLYTAILEAAWMVAETMEGFLEDEIRRRD